MFLKVYQKIPTDCTILCNWVFGNFILADEPFAKTLRNFETCVFVNDSLYGELFSLLESRTTFVKLLQNHFSFFAIFN